MLTEAIKQRVEAKIQQCIATIEQKYNVKFKKPAINYDLRGTTAGMAHYKKWVVNFNPVLLSENTEAFLGRTVPHEIAHLATELIYPHAHVATWGKKRSPHGIEWASIMTTLGAPVSRCHSYDVTNAKVKRKTTYKYVCGGCGVPFSLGPKRHAALQNGKVLWHTKCGKVRGKLVFDSVQFPNATVATTKIVVPTGETKLAKCYRLFQQYTGYSRKEMINAFVREAGCTEAGAGTYYATCKKMHS